jgi:hypothetical protein
MDFIPPPLANVEMKFGVGMYWIHFVYAFVRRHTFFGNHLQHTGVLMNRFE